MKVLELALVTSCVVVIATPAFAQAPRASQPLPGYQCMSLAKLWDGVGPKPPPVSVYSGPEHTATAVGIAGGTVIVPSPLRPVNGRSMMIFPDGRQVWINVSDIAPWRAAADPNATCRPVLLPNGRYGFDNKS